MFIQINVCLGFWLSEVSKLGNAVLFVAAKTKTTKGRIASNLCRTYLEMQKKNTFVFIFSELSLSLSLEMQKKNTFVFIFSELSLSLSLSLEMQKKRNFCPHILGTERFNYIQYLSHTSWEFGRKNTLIFTSQSWKCRKNKLAKLRRCVFRVSFELKSLGPFSSCPI